MKKFILLLTALLMISFPALTQIKMCIYQEDGTRTEYIASTIDSIVFEKSEDKGFVAKYFSVSDSKAVVFSHGNLQYHPANKEWRFAPSQTDYIGENNTNLTATYNGWIDLFGWGTGKSPTNKSDDNNDYSSFVDWGVNKIDNDISNTWRTLTEDEWFYLLTERKDATSLVGLATINGVFGLVLLPDNWLCPDGINFVNSLAQGYYQDYSQKFSSYDWIKLESTGAVFLPAAGNRSGTRCYGQQTSGAYWSATEDDNYSWKAYGLTFEKSSPVTSGISRSSGLSVRLVKE